MRLKKMFLEGFLAYESEVIDLSETTYAVITGKNGAGKSSIFQAISWAIYGTTRVKSDSDSVVNTDFDSCRVTLVLEARGSEWKIVRTRDRGKKSGLALFQKVNGEWVRFGDHLNASAQKHILDIVGMSQDAWNSLVMLSADTGSMFTTASSSTRREILLSLVPELAVWQELENAAKSQLQAESSALSIARARVDDIRSNIEREEEALSDLNDRVTSIGDIESIYYDIARIRALLSASEGGQTFEFIQAQIAAVKNERASFEEVMRHKIHDVQRRLDHYAQLDADVQQATQRQADLTQELASLTDSMSESKRVLAGKKRAVSVRQKKYDTASQLVAGYESQIATLQGVLAELNKRLVAIADNGAGKCFVCDSDISEDRFNSIVDEIHRQIDTSNAQVSALQGDIDKADLEGAHNDLSVAENELYSAQKVVDDTQRAIERLEEYLAQTRERLTRLQETISGLDSTPESAAKELDVLSKERQAKLDEYAKSIKELESQIQENTSTNEHELQERLAYHTRLLNERNRLLGAIGVTCKKIKEYKDALEKTQKSVEDSVALVEDLSFVHEATKPSGVPTLLIDSILSEIEEEQNAILSGIPGGENMRVEFRTKKALKSKDGAKDVLDIIVHDGSGFERSIESFSSGERVRLTISNMFAMAKVFGRRNPDAVSTIMLDEPLGALDIEAVSAFVEVLQSAVASGVAESILVVSHDEKVIESLPQVIEVSKDVEGAGSKIRIR